MSGILDNKSRVIDAILTYEGRRQIADGNFVVKYATFSDKEVVYQLDSTDGHVDPTTKIYLETYNSVNDQITFEADDSGRLQPFRQHASFDESSVDDVQKGIAWKSFINGKIKTRLQTYSESATISGEFSESNIVGDTFASQLEGILTSSVDNFGRLGILGTTDALFEDYYFSLNNNQVIFDAKMNPQLGFKNTPISVNNLPTLFEDKKTKNAINFEYLPPIKKVNFPIDKTNISLLTEQNLLLGNYPAWGPIEEYTYGDILNDIETHGAEAREINFDPTSRDNDIVAQFFEISNDEAKKLDVVDYGKFYNNTNNPKQLSHSVFFVGKVVTNDSDANCFIHMFTVIFEENNKD